MLPFGRGLYHPKLYLSILFQFNGIVKVKMVFFENLSVKGKMVIVKLRTQMT